MTKAISEKVCSGCYWSVELLKTKEIICSIAQDEVQDFTVREQCEEKVYSKKEAQWKIEKK